MTTRRRNTVKETQAKQAELAALRQSTIARKAATMGLDRAVHVDDSGRSWVVLVPSGETNTGLGIVQGPPDVSELGLPKEVAIRLHNELFIRGLITSKDIRGRALEVAAAVMAAYRVDVVALLNLYGAE